MTVIFAFAALYLLFSFAAFGAVFLCLARTPVRDISWLAAVAAWPALMVLCGSCAGYLHADRKEGPAGLPGGNETAPSPPPAPHAPRWRHAGGSPISVDVTLYRIEGM